MESPSENFQRLRDFVDVRNCMTLSNYQPDYLLEGFHPAMASEAGKKLKLNKVHDCLLQPFLLPPHHFHPAMASVSV